MIVQSFDSEVMSSVADETMDSSYMAVLQKLEELEEEQKMTGIRKRKYPVTWEEKIQQK